MTLLRHVSPCGVRRGLRAGALCAALVLAGCTSGSVSVGVGMSVGYGYGYGYSAWPADPWLGPPMAAVPPIGVVPGPMPIRPLPAPMPQPMPMARPMPRPMPR
jgi:hypothetical protein